MIAQLFKACPFVSLHDLVNRVRLYSLRCADALSDLDKVFAPFFGLYYELGLPGSMGDHQHRTCERTAIFGQLLIYDLLLYRGANWKQVHHSLPFC
jgi:hypothetical protein